MCQTALISQSIVRLGTRSYRHRLEALAPNKYRVETLRKLNHDLDSFYDFLYAQCNSITEMDYHIFGEQLKSMLVTLKMLYQTCKRMPKKNGMSHEAEKLKRNYSALYELNEDIKNYRINASKDAEWISLLSDAGSALKCQLMISFKTISSFRSHLSVLLKIKRKVYANVENEIKKEFLGKPIEQIRQNNDMILLEGELVVIKLRLPEKKQS